VKIKSNAEFGRGGELNTIIGKGSSVKGDLKIQNSLRIDGQVKGKIDVTDTVVVGKEGRVVGEINAKNVMLAGKVQGNVTAEAKVLLESKSSVTGDIKASRLVIDEGAFFDGKCIMKEGEDVKPEQQTQVAGNG